jgi:hypothetical protein
MSHHLDLPIARRAIGPDIADLAPERLSPDRIYHFGTFCALYRVSSTL